MNEDPFLSIVAASRNDDHGGNLLSRMQLFVNGLAAQCRRHNVNAELVLTEWNPPENRPRLSHALRWPEVPDGLAIRIIEVPPPIHASYGGPAAVPFHQFIAKNVAIRRARGLFVLATNVDVLLPDAVMEPIAAGRLDGDAFYRCDRHDVRQDVPPDVPLDEQLAFCERSVIRVHQMEGSRDLVDGGFDRIYRSRLALSGAVWSYPLAFVPFALLAATGATPGQAARDKLAEHRNRGGDGPGFLSICWDAYRASVRYAERSLVLRDKLGQLHTNASGDFTLMERDRWLATGGYWEFTGFPMHIDGLLCHAARVGGAREVVLPPPARVYHIEHGEGSGYARYRADGMWAELDGKGIHRITSEMLAEMLVDMADGKDVTQNPDDWGLDGVRLAEWSPPVSARE